MPASNYALIVNPHSAHGRTGRDWANLERAFHTELGAVAVFHTENPGHATVLTRQALHAGYSNVVSIGGDGTHFEVLNGFFEGEALINPKARLGIYPCGSGNDLARSLGIPLVRRLSPAYLRESPTLMADIGQLEFSTADGQTGHCYFLNSVHIGIGGLICARVNKHGKPWGGFLSYLWHTLIALGRWQDVEMTVTVDEEPPFQGKVKEIIVANGNYDGGGMRISPMAKLDNGQFEVYVVHAMSLLKTLSKLPILYKGHFEQHPDIVTHFQARNRITIDSPAPTLLGVDGESPGYLPASITLRPQLLPLIGGPAR